MLLIIPCNPTLTVLGILFLCAIAAGIITGIVFWIIDAINNRNCNILHWITNEARRNQAIEDCTYNVKEDPKESKAYGYCLDRHERVLKNLEGRLFELEKKKNSKHTN